jgi:demethylmenaquinone methyltransferase/2-methoxy-6-polyprenyl-1,4-benzoquinol methylase
MDSINKERTHFGYQEIPLHEKQEKVGKVFSSVAKKYDLMNDLMSFGIHRLWKRLATYLTPVREGQCVLDLAGGTGDLTKLIAKKVGPKGSIYLADINAEMLGVGRDNLLDEGMHHNVHFIQANAEQLPFLENTFDCITIGFGLRNVSNIDRALASMYGTLKPGGCLMILEFSKPTTPLLQAIYDTYSFNILPKLGAFIADDAASYQYLVESIRMHPDQKTLKEMMLTAGFDQVEVINMTGGIVAIHQGFKF